MSTTIAISTSSISLTLAEKKRIQNSIIKGLLDVTILSILDDAPTHGYILIKQIKQKTGVKFAASSIYPLLLKLEKQKLLKSQWQMVENRQIKVYTITAVGKAELHFAMQTLNAYREA